MKREKRRSETFNLGFLDVITCGFGAIILLIIIVKPIPVESIIDGKDSEILEQIAELSLEVTDLKNLLSKLSAQELNERDVDEADERLRQQSIQIENQASKLQQVIDENEALEIALESLKRATIQVQAQPTERDPEVGGIPVDSEYVIFVTDNSGSMQEIWDQVLSTINHLLDVHPTVKGFQVLNDNGQFLVESSRRKWMPDTPRRRNFVRNHLREWRVFSNSSPAEGIHIALQVYAKKYDKISIYVLGDEFYGPSYDEVVEVVENWNPRTHSGEPKVRVHGIGFMSRGGTERYATLMRAVTEKNRGSFLGLPIQ